MVLPFDFSPTIFAYLNPDVHCPSDEFASRFFDDGGESRLYSTTGLPDNFDAHAYLKSNATDVNVAALNREVFGAMMYEGNFTIDEIVTSSTVLNTINQAVHVVAAKKRANWRTIFRFNDPSYRLSPNMLVTGDRLQVSCCASSSPPKHTDVSVVDVDVTNELFTTSNLNPSSWTFDKGMTYVVAGHHICDIDRVGTIHKLRHDFGDSLVPQKGTDGSLAWSSNAAFEALRVGAWCSNTMTPIAATEALDSAIARLAESSVSKSKHGVVADLAELEAQTLVASNLMARETATIGSRFGERPEISLDVHGAVRAEDYIVSSDGRTKRDIVALDAEACIRAVESMEPVRYERILDGAVKYGFVAQDLGAVDDVLVKRIGGYVPSIMKELDVDSFGVVRLESHGLGIGDRLLLAAESSESSKKEIVVNVRRVLDEGTFVIDGQCTVYGTKPLFVGREVPDFHVIDQANLVGVLAGALKGVIASIRSITRPI